MIPLTHTPTPRPQLRRHLCLSVALPLSIGMIACVIAALVPLYSSTNDWNSRTSDAIQRMSLTAATTRLSKLNENLQLVYDQLIRVCTRFCCQ